MPDDPTTPALPPFLGGRVYIPSDVHAAPHWRRDLTAEPKLHRLLAHVWASFDDGFINIDALHLLDELVGGPPTWLSTTEPEPPPEDWQHAASVEGPRGLVQFVHKGEEASRAALAKLVNSASVFVTRPLSAGPTLDDEDTQEDPDDVGGMVVETDPVEACLDLVSEAIEELVHPGTQPTLVTGEQSGVLKLGDVELSCMKANGIRLLRSLLYTAEAIVSTKGDGASVEAVLAAHYDTFTPPTKFHREQGRVLRPAQGKPEPTMLSFDEQPPGQEPLFDVETCALCDCTDDAACEGGCHWVHAEPWICSECERREGSLEAAVAKAEAWAAEDKAKKSEDEPDDDPGFAMTDDFVGPVPSGNGPEWFDEEIVALPLMVEPATVAVDVPTVILPEMPLILVRWLVVDEDGECVCYVLAASEDDARRRAEEHGAEPDDRLSPDPYMLDDWEEDRPLLQDEGAWIHARRRHLTWKLLDAVKRTKVECVADEDDPLWWYFKTPQGTLLNPGSVTAAGLLKLLWDCRAQSPDESLLSLGQQIQVMAQDSGQRTPGYRPPHTGGFGDGSLTIVGSLLWVGAEFDEVARCLLQLAQACVDPGYRLPDELPASEVPTVELPAPLVTDMADAVGLADDEEPSPAVTNHEGYTRICREHTKATTLVWRTEHNTTDHLEVTCRIPGDRLREALGISLDELVKARRRDAAAQALDTALINLRPVPGFPEDVTVSESEDGKVCVSLQGRALVAADEEGGKILRALGELFQTRTIPW